MTIPGSPVRDARLLAEASRRPVPPLDPGLRAELVDLLAAALVEHYRQVTGPMGASSRGPAHTAEPRG